MYSPEMIEPETVFLSKEQEKEIMNEVYDFVIRTTRNSEKASPAELEALPTMFKLLIDYWAVSN